MRAGRVVRISDADSRRVSTGLFCDRRYCDTSEYREQGAPADASGLHYVFHSRSLPCGLFAVPRPATWLVAIRELLFPDLETLLLRQIDALQDAGSPGAIDQLYGESSRR